jgi:hypothetical protein
MGPVVVAVAMRYCQIATKEMVVVEMLPNPVDPNGSPREMNVSGVLPIIANGVGLTELFGKSKDKATPNSPENLIVGSSVYAGKTNASPGTGDCVSPNSHVVLDGDVNPTQQGPLVVMVLGYMVLLVYEMHCITPLADTLPGFDAVLPVVITATPLLSACPALPVVRMMNKPPSAAFPAAVTAPDLKQNHAAPYVAL